MHYIILFAVGIILIVLTLKYPVISLIFFLTTSVLKGALMVKFPFFRVVDFTVLCGAYTLLAMGYSFFRGGGQFRTLLNGPTLIYFLLCIFLFLGLTYTTAPEYGLEKSSRFATLGLIGFLAPIVFARNLRDFKIVFWILIFVGLVLSVTTVIAPDLGVIRESAESRGSFLEANPLETATKIGVTAVILFCFLIMVKTTLAVRIFSVGGICIAIIGIIVTASRGPFVGLLLTWFIAFYVCRRYISKGWLPIVTIACFLALILPFIFMQEEVTARIASVFRSKHEFTASTMSRTPMYQYAWENSWKSPLFGHGTGAFAVAWTGADRRYYPHNMILELFYEQGFVGVVIGGIFLLLIFIKWYKAAHIVHYYDLDIFLFKCVHISGLLYFFTLLQAMKSADLDGNRFMFFCAGMVLASLNTAHKTLEMSYSAASVAEDVDTELMSPNGYDVSYSGY